MNIPFFDLARQHAAYADEIEGRMLKVAGSGSYILGPHTARLEDSVAGYLGVSHGAGVASGTDALHLAIAALQIGAGDEV